MDVDMEVATYTRPHASYDHPKAKHIRACCFIDSAAASHTSWRVIAGSAACEIVEIQGDAKTVTPQVKLHQQPVTPGEAVITGIDCSNDGSRILYCTGSGLLRIAKRSCRNIDSSPILTAELDFGTILNSCAFLPFESEGPGKAVVGTKRGVDLIDIQAETSQCSRVQLEQDFRQDCILQVCPISSKLAATASTDGRARVVDFQSRTQSIMDFKHPSFVYSVSTNANTNYVLTGCRDGLVRLWDKRNPSLLVLNHSHTLGVTSCVLSDNDKLAVSCSAGHLIKAWDLQEDIMITSIEGTKGFTKVALSTNREMLVASTFGGSVHVYDLAHSERARAQGFLNMAKLPMDLDDNITKFLW